MGLRQQILSGNKTNVYVTAIAAGLYPLIHYYNSNLTLANSLPQFVFLFSCYLLIPISIFWIFANLNFDRIKILKPYKRYFIPILNLCVFTFLIILDIYGLKQKKLMLITIVIAILIAVILYKHFYKIIVFQLLLALVGLVSLIPKLYFGWTYSLDWTEQPDQIEAVQFKKVPNIYIIQPDGYASFSELKKGYYKTDNKHFETFLKEKGFQLYKSFRSNYTSTLSSNASMFAMKHHYYQSVQKSTRELYNARDFIVGDNPVHRILKQNGYTTSLIIENAYFLANQPEVKYDYCNVALDEVPYMSRGFEIKKDVLSDLEFAMSQNPPDKNFYFIEKNAPSHVASKKHKSLGKVKEREKYLKKLDEVNVWLKKIVSSIVSKDKNAMIVIVADHGGFVGMDATEESRAKQTDKDLVNSMFASALAIKWPKEEQDVDIEFNSSVNLFRGLFSYLSENKEYLGYFQEDKSYNTIEKGAPRGIYELIDEKGNVTFDKLN